MHAHANSQPSHNLSLSQRAVSLLWLVHAFLPEHPEVQRDNMTTGAVMADIIRQETKADHCRYTDLMLRDVDRKEAVSQVRIALNYACRLHVRMHADDHHAMCATGTILLLHQSCMEQTLRRACQHGVHAFRACTTTHLEERTGAP